MAMTALCPKNEKMQQETISRQNGEPGSQASDSEYINFVTDYAFQGIFKTESLAVHFLNEVLDGFPYVKKITYLDREITKERYQTTGISDILCVDEYDREFIIQIQRFKQEFFMDLSVFYASSRIVDNAPKEQKSAEAWDFRQRPVIFIALLDFNMPGSDPDNYKHVIQLCDIEENRVVYDKLTFIFLELSKLDG